MSEENRPVGVSKTAFLVGIVIAIVVSSAIPIAYMYLIKGPSDDQRYAEKVYVDEAIESLEENIEDKCKTVVFAHWDVSWRTLTGDLVWGAEVGTSEFCGTFDYDWGTYALFMEYDDYIGFEASMQVKMERDGPIAFTIGSDDGSKLRIDGVERIDNWGTGRYHEKTIFAYLSKGFHTLTLSYYEVSGNARVSFDCDSDILTWYD